MKKLTSTLISIRLEVEDIPRLNDIVEKLSTDRSKLIRGFVKEGITRRTREIEGFEPGSDTQIVSYKFSRTNGRIIYYGISSKGQEFKLGELEVKALYEMAEQVPVILFPEEIHNITKKIKESLEPMNARVRELEDVIGR